MSSTILRGIRYQTLAKLRSASSKAHAPRRRQLGLLSSVALVSGLCASCYVVGAVNPPGPVTILYPRTAPPPPDPSTPESQAYVRDLEEKLQSHPVLVALRAQPDANEWYETRPYDKISPERLANSLTAGALKGPGKLALKPLVRARRDEQESMVFIHVGRGLCGHDGIIHGGMLATLLDETLARTAILNLPEKIGVTANLSLNYRAPTKADQFIVIKTKLVNQKGRKAVVEGRIEDMDGNHLVDSTATFVQPKYAKLLNTAAVKEAIGAPSDDLSVPVHLGDGESINPRVV